MTRIPDQFALAAAGFLARVSRGLIGVALIGGLFGIVFGVISSRYLTAPLGQLVEAARSIGRRDFSRRLALVGSDEIQEGWQRI